MSRLRTIAPDLEDQLRRATAQRQRALAIAAARYALRVMSVDDGQFVHVLSALDRNGVLSPEDKRTLNELVEKLDDEYFALSDSTESENAVTGPALLAFRKARAVSAVLFAGNDDSFDAASEAIYEATATTDDQREFFKFIEGVLN